MDIQISRCYYHPGRSAVAVCSECGVGICRECAVKYGGGKILCYHCGNEYLRQEHKEYRKELKKTGGRFRYGTDFIIPGIIGVLIVAAFGVMFHFGIVDDPTNGENTFTKFAVYCLYSYMLFSIPFSYIALSDLLAPKYDFLDTKLIKWVLKFFLSLAIGWIFFTFVWIRFIVRKNSSHKI